MISADALFGGVGWCIEHGVRPAPSGGESLSWQDPATELSIWNLRTKHGLDGHRLIVTDLTVDLLPPNRVVVYSKADPSPDSINHFLVDQVFPRLLANSSSFVVHAGAIRVGGGSLLMLGQSGRGKSTLSASFDRAGFRLIGDDAIILSSQEDRTMARAVYPSLRLFPDSIAALLPGEQTAGAVAHYTSKERIDVPVDPGASDKDCTVIGLICLGPANESRSITMRSMSPADSCMALVKGGFSLDPGDTIKAARRLRQASLFADAIPAWHLSFPRDYAHLPDVRQAILDQVAALEPA